MTELLTAAQMRAVEEAAIESGEVTGLVLMERAGRGVVKAIFDEWPELRATSHRAVILCGPGNNGGDGFVVARLLREWGWDVAVFLFGDPERLPPDAKLNHDRWTDLGTVAPLDRDHLKDVDGDVFVDAIFGAGLSRPPPVEILETLTSLHASDRSFGRMVSIDAPTGLCMDSGRNLSADYDANWSWLTVTFHRQRPGHHLSEGPSYCGRLRVVDIGLMGMRETDEALLQKIELQDWGPRSPTVLGKPGFGGASHKYDHGHALVLSGGSGRGGAARLAARGALRIGAGLVTVGCPPEALTENAAQLTAIMLRPIANDDTLTRSLEDTRLNALCLGPGLGVSEDTRALVSAALAGGAKNTRIAARGVQGDAAPAHAPEPRRSVVLDADALTAFADDTDQLFTRLNPNCVLTPHAGEFARLFPDLAQKLTEPASKGPAYSKLDATREAAARAGCTVLYKGPDTVIADQTGAARINSADYDRSVPWLATAGSGDVLAGFITGLLARGLTPLDAASTAAWLHVECALGFGPGLIAEDIPEELPKVFRALGL